MEHITLTTYVIKLPFPRMMSPVTYKGLIWLSPVSKSGATAELPGTEERK